MLGQINKQSEQRQYGRLDEEQALGPHHRNGHDGEQYSEDAQTDRTEPALPVPLQRRPATLRATAATHEGAVRVALVVGDVLQIQSRLEQVVPLTLGASEKKGTKSVKEGTKKRRKGIDIKKLKVYCICFCQAYHTKILLCKECLLPVCLYGLDDFLV